MPPPRGSNQYYVCLRRGDPPIPWTPGHGAQINKHTAYFGGVLRAVEEGLREGGLTFYLTWDVGRLPTYGDDVVAVVLGDEWARVPAYAHRVRAVFKCYGIGSWTGARTGSTLSYLSVLTALQSLQRLGAQIPGVLGHRIQQARHPGRPGPSLHVIPLGYANQVDLPVVPIHDRRHDVSFAGSVVHKQWSRWSVRRWLQTPKTLSRSAMVAALAQVERSRPDWDIGLTLTSSYDSIRSADPEVYSRLLMDTKVTLVPRGTSFETFRYFEAMRAGCVVICETLPPRWFYDESPAVQIDRWENLESTLTALLDDEAGLQQRHEATLEWWRTRCSEEAVGAFVRDKLNALEPARALTGAL